MVQSKIIENINYKEQKGIDLNDINKEASIYEIPFEKSIINVAIGNADFQYRTKEHDNIVVFPIYFVKDDKVIEKIGVYEVETNDISSLYDEEEDLDIGKLSDPLFFSYATTKRLLSKDNDFIQDDDDREDDQEDEEI